MSNISLRLQNQAKIPSMGLHPDLLNPTESQSFADVQSEASQSTESEPLPDQDILESIESIYYKTDECFDCCRHELQKLPEILNSKTIERDYKRLKQEHQVVSKKVLQLILQKQNSCKEEFERILYIQGELQNALEICQTGRADLNLAKKQFTTASLGILANYQKKKVVQGLLHSLNTIKTLVRSFVLSYLPQAALPETSFNQKTYFSYHVLLIWKCSSERKTGFRSF